MLIGSFAFASNSNTVEKSEIFTVENSNLTNYLNSVSTNYSIELVSEKSLDCLLTITFVFEDGSTETVYVLVKGASCEEILG